MARPRKHRDNAAKQRAYRERTMGNRERRERLAREHREQLDKRYEKPGIT